MMKNITILTICIGIGFLGCAEKMQKVTLVEEPSVIVPMEVVAPQIIEEKTIHKIVEVVTETEELNSSVVVETEEEVKKRELEYMIENTPLILKNKSSERAYE